MSAAPQTRADGPRFEIAFSRAARAEPVTGMVYVAISRDTRRPPIEQTSPTGVPLFSHFVEGLQPDSPAAITVDDRGHPIRSLRDIPAGEYWMQPFVNVYTRFPRADGHTVWLHNDQWEGQDWKQSPGNLFGDPVKVSFDPEVVHANPPRRRQSDPADSGARRHRHGEADQVSEHDSDKWWGQPIYLGATVLLPKGYDTHPDVRYPVNYMQGHFSLGAPGGYGRGGDFDRVWMADGTPRFIYVTLQHPSPYYDDSYGVNSENNGPYGDAIMKELIPAVEVKFRAIRQPWARMLTGGSTGGWIAARAQVFYPDFYGGSFASVPTVDFRYHQIVNIYNDTNAYFIDKGWMKIERPNERRPDGNIEGMMKDENWFELVVGRPLALGRPVGHLGGDVLAGRRRRVSEAHLGQEDRRHRQEGRRSTGRSTTTCATSSRPTGRRSGPKVAQQDQRLRRRHGLVLSNMGVHMLNEFLTKADDPKFTGEIVFQPMAPHCWGPRGAELLQKLEAQVEKGAPAGMAKNWKY